MLRYVWFDLGNTLVHVHREEVYQKKLEKCGIYKPLDNLQLAFHLADKYFMREFPGLLGKKHEVYAESYCKVLHQFLDVEIDPIPQILIEPGDARYPKGEWRVFSETIPTLEALKAEGLNIGLISNWNHTAKEVLRKTGIMPYLDEVVISSELEIEKPDKRIFQYAFEQADVCASECVYVGDNYYDDVLGCRQVGMKCILINPFGRKGIEEVHNVPIITNLQELMPTIDSIFSVGKK